MNKYDFIIITRLGGTLINTDKCVGNELNDWTSNEHLRFLGASGGTVLGLCITLWTIFQGKRFTGLEAINCDQFSKRLPSIMSWGSYHVNNVLVKYNINHFFKVPEHQFT